MAKIYLFTWNLRNKTEAHDLTLDHLALRGKDEPFIACLQELPRDSLIAKARRKTQQELASRNMAVVSTPTLARGIALVHRADLKVVGTPTADEDEEFVAAVLQRPADPKKIAVIGVHAKSKADMHCPEDHGGSRALLRHAIHALRLGYDHQIVLGDFNSDLESREVQSWYGFYALSSNKPITKPAFARRRGFDHPPLYAVRPLNETIGTFELRDSGSNETPTVDYVVVDEATRSGANAKILTEVAGKSVWDSVEERPNMSDHLPVEGMVDI